MTFPDLTVVVPTFNRPDGLTKAVLSLFAQRYVKTRFTLIIVDNAPDNSALQAIRKNVIPRNLKDKETNTSKKPKLKLRTTKQGEKKKQTKEKR